MLNKRLLGMVLALVACQVQAQAPSATCPQRLRVLDQRGALVDAQLFIGLPEKKRELKRAGKQRQWVLAKLHKRATAAHDGLYLQCRYKDMKASVTLPVPPVAAACIIGTGSEGETTVHCQ